MSERRRHREQQQSIRPLSVVKVPTPVVKVVLIGGHGMMFGEGGLEKEMHMEKEKKVWDTEKLKNRDSIVFLLLLDTGEKVV